MLVGVSISVPGPPPRHFPCYPGVRWAKPSENKKRGKKKKGGGGGGKGACRFGSAGECHGGSGKCNKLFRRRATSLALLAHYAFACTLLLFTRYHNMAAQHGGLGSSRLCHSIVFSVFGAGDEERGGGLEGIFFSAAVVVLVRLLVASRSCLLAYANIHQRQRHSYCTGRSVLFKFKCSLFSPTIWYWLILIPWFLSKLFSFRWSEIKLKLTIILRTVALWYCDAAGLADPQLETMKLG